MTDGENHGEGSIVCTGRMDARASTLQLATLAGLLIEMDNYYHGKTCS